MLRWLGLILSVGVAVIGLGYDLNVRDPVMRQTTLPVAGWPDRTPPLRVALISDVHIQGPDMPPARAARLVAQVNAQHPDLILLAGDFSGDRTLSTRHYSAEEIAAPLAGLRARLGVYGVLGNHDHWRTDTPIRDAMAAAGITMLDNEARQVGPLTLVGLGDGFTKHARIDAVEKQAATMQGPVLLFTHTPDEVPKLPSRFGLVLAGHTHCGQAVFPLVGAPVSSSRYGDRYRCGIIHEDDRTIVVTAGWGSSVLPLRYGAPPDWWLLTLGAEQQPTR